MLLRIRWVFVALGLLAFSLPAARAADPAGDFPNRPIRWIIPFPPGGSNDLVSRFLAARLTPRLGQQVVIDNRGGANGIIADELAANSPPDGYTLLMINSSFVMNAVVRPMRYDVNKSFDPISSFAQSPESIVVFPGSGMSSLRELVDRAKAKPGAMSYATTGFAGFNHFGGALFCKVAGINMVMVPYKGGGPAMTDVIAGNIPVMFTSVTQVLAHVRAGRIRMLAVGLAKRSPVLPDVPTVIESGFPGYEVAVWWGVSAPAGTPRPVQERLRRTFDSIIGEPETQKFFASDAAVPLTLTQAEFRKLLRDEFVKWSAVAKDAGIRAN
jgi:tripartite-type tricarboxylate transporter receptor subunit TctC